MKLIIAGATGLLGTEVVRQSLQIPDITEVIALSRKPVHLDKDVDTSKLQSVIIRDYGEYPEDVKAHLAKADACIWTFAITPFRTGSFDFLEVKRVCQDCTRLGFEAMYEAGPVRPFRFMYLSAEGTPRDSEKRPFMMGDYQVMRCNTELTVLRFRTEKDGVEVCIAQPGVITNSTTWSRALVANICRIINIFGRPFPNVHRSELAAAVLEQVMNGFEKEILSNADLVRIVRTALELHMTGEAS
ncbi:hypothetical protein N7475_007348 [Penicillium sp. IBT 31633x]|nr:hypothetical protein N7475_007348 [Penicillium sp. IBT 31633x]